MTNKELMKLEPNFIPAKRSKKKLAGSIGYYVFGTILSLFFLLPIFYMVSASTKTQAGIARDAGTLMMFLPNFSDIGDMFSNYNKIFIEYEVWKNAVNSFVYAIIVIIFNILINGLAGYVLAKFDFPAKGFFNFIILFLIVVPVETSIIPLYSIVRNLLHIKQGFPSVFAVLLPSFISVFNIFLFTQFFSSIPKEYEEAMHIDGSNRVRVFFDLILPMSKPIVATTAVFTFIGVWNDYLWPFMVLPKGESSWSLMPIQAHLQSIQTIPGITEGQIMAALVITSIPIFVLYAAAQKYIVKGFGTAGLKM